MLVGIAMHIAVADDQRKIRVGDISDDPALNIAPARNRAAATQRADQRKAKPDIQKIQPSNRNA